LFLIFKEREVKNSSVDYIMIISAENGKGFGRKRSLPNEVNIAAFVWRGGGKQ
jgi:hypothetical protein